MDEPFGALDAMTREQMNCCSSGSGSRRERPCSSTHSIPEAIFLAGRVIVMSPRPGRVVDVLKVDLPRPRDLDVMTSAPFGALVRRVR